MKFEKIVKISFFHLGYIDHILTRSEGICRPQKLSILGEFVLSFTVSP